MADPGFPIEGDVDLVGGAVDPRGGYVSKILHVKTKESGPGGGARRARPPRSANGHTQRGACYCLICLSDYCDSTSYKIYIKCVIDLKMSKLIFNVNFSLDFKWNFNVCVL